ncbi:hypothetical protein [Gandjariella thermophila]|nr:hypothetical protein [Gandjariella thermophila]
MNPATLAAAARYFPLLGRPRPACPSLTERVQEIADVAHAARQGGTNGLAAAADALNRAALIASDCGLPNLARDLCWRHIDVYRGARRPLTVLEARRMLEPVLNLARLRIRAGDGEQALRLLASMYQAVTSNTDLVLDGHTLPLAEVTGTRYEHHKLREWVWLHLLGDGIRALTLAGRWDQAVAHAQAHRGIGLHLMEGRQATIVAHCLNGAPAAAQAALAESTPKQPWELQVASCLKVMCTHAGRTPASREITAMIENFLQGDPVPGYAVFRCQLGLAVTTLVRASDSGAAEGIFSQVVDEAIDAEDGYGAREVLRFPAALDGLTSEQRNALTDLVTSSGLGAGTLPDSLLHSLFSSTHTAAEVLSAFVAQTEPAGTWA